MAGSVQGPVDRVQFLNEVFKEVRPPEKIERLLQQDPRTLPDDSLEAMLTWATEAQIQPLAVLIEADLAMNNPTEANITSAARNLVFSGAEYRDIPVVSAFLFQQGKVFIDKGMGINSKNVPLRNAYITYLSEYENEPMKFLGILRETLTLDSNNVETHFIHLNLLKKSEQWKKAIDKCQKLISLQPQNPIWLFQISDIYGFTGDSVNAKFYLDLAVRAQKKEQENNQRN